MPETPVELIRTKLLDGASGLAAAARRVMRWHGLSIWITSVLGTLLLLLVGDMLLRREETGLRVLALLSWLAIAIVAAIKYLRPAWKFSPTPLQVTSWIEHSRPELDGQLSTAVELASLPDDANRYGSSGFRNAVLRSWADRQPDLDWRAYLQTSGLRRSFAACGVAILLLLGLSVLWPYESGLALARLTMPWSSYYWPKRDQLILQNPPTVVAAGSDLQLEIIDGSPPLPEQIDVQIRSAKTGDALTLSAITTIPATQLGDMAVANLPTMTEAIEIRAIGGEDRSMAWHRIDVVNPPELLRYQFAVVPPDYTRLPAVDIAGRRIQVLSGSAIEFSGTFSEPVASVTIQLAQAVNPSDPVPLSEASTIATPQTLTAHLGTNGRDLRLAGSDSQPLTVTVPLAWQLWVTTRDGLKLLQPERWAIEVTSDAPPTVVMQQAELTELSIDATLPIRGQADDDLGLADIVAYMSLSEPGQFDSREFPVWPSNRPQLENEFERTIAFDAIWEITRGAPLVVDQTISVWLEARDTSGQLGKSQIQTFQVREPAEIVRSIQDKQNKVHERVRALTDAQRRNAELMNRTWESTQVADKIGPEQLDVFRNIAGVQREILKQLKGDRTSVASELIKLRELLTQNNLGQTDLAIELDSLSNRVEAITQNDLQSAATSADQTATQAQSSLAAAKSSLSPALARAANDSTEAQTQAVRTLESLMDRLANNEALQQVQRELSQILEQQSALRGETDQLQLQRLSQVENDEFRARKAALAADQQGLARRLDDLLHRADELRSTAGDDQQSLKNQIQRATQGLVDLQASSKMRRSTDELRDDRLAQAASSQQEVAELLNNALQQLGVGSASQLGGLQTQVDNLRQSSQALSDLAAEQLQLAQRMGANDAASNRNSLVENQSELQQRTSAQANTSAQMGDASLSAELQRAVESQQRSQDSAENNELAPAAEAAQTAAELLADSAEQLENRAEQLEQEVLQQQLFQFSTAIVELKQQQSTVSEQFHDAANVGPEDSKEIRESQQNAIRSLASQQEAVRQMLRDVRMQTEKLPTFDWALEQAEQAMSRAVAAAQRFRVQPDASLAADDALRILDLAAEALRESPSTSSPNQDAAQADEAEETEAAERPIPALASLRLLRALQQDINRQSLTIEAEPNSANRAKRLAELSALQQSLGGLTEQLVREIAAASGTGDN